MIPRKIQLLRVAPFMLLVVSGATLFAPKNTNAQCPAGQSVTSVTYTKSLSSAGGSVYNFTMPQFNPSPGGYTLISAVLSSVATTNITINYQNTSTNHTQDFFPSVSRTDFIKVNGSTTVNKNNQFDYDETLLSKKNDAGDNVTYGPGATFDNSTLFTTTVTNAGTLTSTYQGSGNINIAYTSIFYTNNFVPTDVTVTPTIADNINFSITYNYCSPTILSSNILTFTAEKENNKTVELKWSTTNEQPGRKYYIEASVGNQDFAIVGTVASDASSSEASYTYDYAIPLTATGKIYFRLRQVDPDGTTAWSDVRTIDLDGNGTGSVFSIYPNPPSDYINLNIPGNNQDWQIDIFAADGSLVQRNYFRNSNAARVNFARRYSAGTYFVRATSPQTGKQYTGSFLIR